MGLFLSFYLNFDTVTDAEWELAYQDSLQWLQRFPIPLTRLEEETLLGEKRLVWTTHLEKNKDTQGEAWDVIGDNISFKRAENFTLYRYLPARVRDAAEENGKVKNAFSKYSVFYADVDEGYVSSQYGVDVFGGWARKTQGYPFHLAILAVCICLENRFEGRGYLHGDFDETQAEETLKWMNSYAETPLQMPVCLDAARLWKYVREAHDSDTAAIRRFLRLCLFEKNVAYKHLATFASRKALLEVLADDLADYTSLQQIGAVDIWLAVLSVWEDIDATLDLVILANKRKEDSFFDLSDFLQSICNEYVFTHPLAKEKLNFLHQKEEENLNTIDDFFQSTMLTMFGHGKRNIQIYLPLEEIWEAFMAKDPQNAQKYRDIIDEAAIKNEAQLAELDAEIARWAERIEAEEGGEEDEEEGYEEDYSTENEAESDEIKLLHYPENERYIVKQCLLQAPKFKNLGDSIRNIGEQIRAIISEEEFLFDTTSEYLKTIYAYSKLGGFALTQAAWAKLDTLEDKQLLRMFCVFASLKIEAADLWKWRLYTFEYADKWNYFKGTGI